MFVLYAAGGTVSRGISASIVNENGRKYAHDRYIYDIVSWKYAALSLYNRGKSVYLNISNSYA